MCFYNDDYDWYAEYTDTTIVSVDKPERCFECGVLVQPGSDMYCIYMQEHEMCQVCECDYDEVDDEELLDCRIGKHDYGQVYEYQRCLSCHQFLQAVAQAEIEAGCHRNESQPALECMCDDISNGGLGEARKYFRKALLMFPGLRTSGYLKNIYRRMFSRV